MFQFLSYLFRAFSKGDYSCPWGCGAEFDDISDLNDHIYSCSYKKGQR